MPIWLKYQGWDEFRQVYFYSIILSRNKEIDIKHNRFHIMSIVSDLECKDGITKTLETILMSWYPSYPYHDTHDETIWFCLATDDEKLLKR